jgi:hypothetical protein
MAFESKVQMHSVRKKPERVSLFTKFFTLAHHARLRAEHPPTADKGVRSGGAGWRGAWSPQDDKESIAAIHRALELGVNWMR